MGLQWTPSGCAPRPIKADVNGAAEEKGFEPLDDLPAVSGFQDRSDKPLRHSSRDVRRTV